MLFDAPCADTVSIFEAVLLGAGDACIDLGLPSLLSGVVLFIGSVLVLRMIGMLVLRRIFPRLRRTKPGSTFVSTHNAHPYIPQDAPPNEGLKPQPYESPIRTMGRWGRKAR